MSKFNNSTARSRAGAGPVKSETTSTLKTFNGANGYARDSKSELFLAAVSDFGGEATFYETADNRSKRIAKLTHEVAVQDPEWITNFTTWLRNEANLRSISLTIALEGAKALNNAGVPGGRTLVSGAIRRADEAGEALAYWMGNFGRKIPSAVKRGIADGAVKAFNEYSLAKYDTDSHGFRFGDVIELVHPSPKDAKQSDLFKFALDRRRDASAEPSESLTMLQKRKAFLALSADEKKALVNSGEAIAVLNEAGLTWEVLSSAYGKGGLDAKGWAAIIPSMGYMALLRNLRNFEQAGVSEAVLAQVAARIADPEEVAKSRQLPFRFLAAYNANSSSLRWGFPLEQALKASLANVPVLDDTLILVDRSGSMFGSPSKSTQLSFADSAAVFGSALAIRGNRNTLVQFGTDSQEVSFKKTDSVLTTVKKFGDLGGTATHAAITKHFDPAKHKRVILVTDEQSNGWYYTHTARGTGSYWGGWDRVQGDVLDGIPATVPTYTWNLVGYAAGYGESKPNRTYLGGLSDQAFKLIPLVEAGYDAGWPWETK